MLSEQLLDHFQNPRNTGSLDAPGVINVEVSNPACGDILRLSVLFADGVAREVRFRVRGCTAAIAAGSALTELMQGRSRGELALITASNVEAAVGGLQSASKHAAVLCADGVRTLCRQLDVLLFDKS